MLFTHYWFDLRRDVPGRLDLEARLCPHCHRLAKHCDHSGLSLYYGSLPESVPQRRQLVAETAIRQRAAIRRAQDLTTVRM